MKKSTIETAQRTRGRDTVGIQVAGNIYRNESLKYTYTLMGSGAEQTLYITKDNDPNRIAIRNWSSDKKLGITLLDQAVVNVGATAANDSDFVVQQRKAA